MQTVTKYAGLTSDYKPINNGKNSHILEYMFIYNFIELLDDQLSLTILGQC